MAPDVVLERRDVEIADQDHAACAVAAQRGVVAHLVEEGELVREFRIDLRIGLVAAGRHIEIVQRDRIAQPGVLAEHGRDVAAVGLAAKRLDVDDSNGRREITTTP